MSLFALGLLLLFLGACCVFGLALHTVGKGKFYTDTFALSIFGVYVWGDALVLAPAWAAGALTALLTNQGPEVVFRWFLLFLLVRSFFEIIYWLNQQAVKSAYCPPLLRKVRVLSADAAAITYQLVHTVVVVVCAGILLFVL